jgi:pilus assembly protein CpaF
MADDLTLVIQYTSERPTEHYALGHGRYAVGSMFKTANLEAGEIPLYGRDISPVQFILESDPATSQWYIEPSGTTETYLGAKRIDTFTENARIELIGSQFIQVPGARVHINARPSTGNASSGLDAEIWISLQDQIHENVFRDVSLQTSQEEVDHDSPQVRSKLLKIIERETDSLISATADSILLAIVKSAVRLSALRAIASSSIDDRAEHATDGPQRPGQLKTRTRDLVQRLQLSLSRDETEEDTRKLTEGIDRAVREEYQTMPVGDRRAIARWFLAANVWNSIFNFGPITDLMDLDMISEVMIVRYDRIYIERFEKIERYDYTFASPQRLWVILKRLVNRSGREIDRTHALVDFKLEDGSRVNAVVEPLSRQGPCITIRRHRKEVRISLHAIARNFRTLNLTMAAFLEACVVARKNIVISGGTGSGKTTLLNALSAYIPDGQRVITIEDTAELVLANSHVVSLEARPANVEGTGEVTIRDLLRNALRMRPDRIIIGECRGKEAVDRLQALNTGHAGSMTTAHANGPAEMLMRLEVMVLQGEPTLPVAAIREQIATAVQLIVQLARVMLPHEPDRSMKVVTDIAEVVGLHPVRGDIIIEPIFTFKGFDGCGTPIHRFTGYLPSFVDALDEHRPVLSEGPRAGQRMSLHELFHA